MRGILLLCASLAVQPAETIDRTLAIVAGRSLTLSDARTVSALGLVDRPAVDAALIARLVDRELMLREAERYQPPEPSRQAMDQALAAVAARAGGDAPLEAVLAAGGFTPERLRAWIRDDLRIASYLRQRFADDERRQDQIADWVADLRRRTPITVFEP